MREKKREINKVKNKEIQCERDITKIKKQNNKKYNIYENYKDGFLRLKISLKRSNLA